MSNLPARLAKYSSSDVGVNTIITGGELKQIAVTRYRGDTYPVSCTVSINGNTDMTNIDLVMGIKAEDGTLYSSTGDKEIANLGMINFTLPAGVYDVVGVYEYDIQATDINSIIYTVGSGTIEIVDDIYK